MCSIIDMLLEAVRTGSGERRRAAAALLCAFVSHSRADLTPHVPQLLRGLLLLFADSDRDVLQVPHSRALRHTATYIALLAVINECLHANRWRGRRCPR